MTISGCDLIGIFPFQIADVFACIGVLSRNLKSVSDGSSDSL